MEKVGKFNKKCERNQGFSLIELIIAIAILVILTGLLAPQFMKYIEKSRKAVCISNRDTLVNEIWVEKIMNSAYTDEEAEAFFAKQKGCPSGGTWTLEIKTTHISIECDKHGTISKGLDDIKLTESQEILKDFNEFVSGKTGGLNNDKLREEFLKKYNGKWPVFTVKGMEYEIQPLFREGSSASEISDKVWIFAKSAESSNKWGANFVYNVKDGKWYQAINWSGTQGVNGMLQYGTVDELDEDIKNGMIGKNHKWKEVEDFKITY